ncbi:MAG: hypothetical protein JWP81_5162 [Ferruginibacter sp.]|nr:hypothetical protein [Ferruginibacter sp.]
MPSCLRCILVAYRWPNVALATNVKISGIQLMMPLSIRCYHPSQQLFPDIQFFILSKGNNAGKPCSRPLVNSFVATANNKEMRDFYYWLTYGLHKAQAFKLVNRGSVIPFVNIGETRDIIQPGSQYHLPSLAAIQNYTAAAGVIGTT